MTPSACLIFWSRRILALAPAILACAQGTGSVPATLLPVPKGCRCMAGSRAAGTMIYIVAGEAGQRLMLSFAATIPDACFSVSAPGASEELFEGSSGQSSFDMVLTDTGPYRIRSLHGRRGKARGVGGLPAGRPPRDRRLTPRSALPVHRPRWWARSACPPSYWAADRREGIRAPVVTSTRARSARRP